MGDLVIDGLLVAHENSGHAAPGPPAVSGIMPPTTPAGPPYTPAPFMYIAKSKALHPGTASRKTTDDGAFHRLVKKETVLDVEHPGNMPSKPLENTPPNGSDLITKVACGQARVISAGQSHVTVGDSEIAITGADVILNIPTEKQSVHQSQSKLLDAGGLFLASQSALHNPCVVLITGDPIAVASGEVIDSATDLSLPGMLDLAWTRHYASGRHKERGPLGRGGWRHAFEERIEVASGKLVLHHADGSRAEFPEVAARGTAFNRSRGLELTRALETYEIRSIHDRQTREFTPVLAGGSAVLQSVRDRFGNRIHLIYEEGRLARLVDTAKREVRLVHDVKGRIVRVEIWAREAFQQAVDYGYSDDGDLAVITNALGHVDYYTYDARHRLVEKKLRSGVRFQYHYHPEHGRCVRSTAPGRLQNVELQYDVVARKVISTGNPEPREWTFDARGELLREATFDGTYAFEYAYDKDQLLVAAKNAAGDEWTYEFDERGLLTRRAEPNGFEIAIEYADDLPVLRREGKEVTVIAYDAHGAPIQVTSPSGEVTQHEYDRWGRLVRSIVTEGHVVACRYDDEHNLVAVTDRRGATTRFEYDAMGRKTAAIDALGRKESWQYDTLGRPVLHVMPDGSRIEIEYDAADNVIRTGDGGNATISTEFFGTGSVARRTTADGQSWEMAYDVLERLREIKNPKGEIYEFRYDRAGRLIEETTFDGQTIRYQHSKRDLVSRVDYDDETWMELERDERGCVVKKITPHGTVVYERDEQSRITAAVVEEHGGAVAVEVAWDDQGHVASVTQAGRKIAYTYGPLGRVASRILPNGETTRYHYDPRGALIGVDHEGEKILLQRDVLGREVRRYVYASGLDVQLGYNDDDRITDQLVAIASRGGTTPPTIVVQRKWTYGEHARVRSIQDSRWGTTSYRHDAIGHLIEAQRGDRVESFEYDPAGSLVGMQLGAAAEQGAEPWVMRMGNVLARTPGARYEHDARRRRRRKIDQENGAITEYQWDCKNQLREVKLPSGERVLFKYDAFGRRTRKTVIAPVDPESIEPPRIRVVDFVWDFDEVAMEIDSERGERVFVHDRTRFFPLLQRERGETFAYLTDHLGVPKELIDRQGRVVWSASRTAWGKVLDVARDPQTNGAPAINSPFAMLGQYADEETGLAYTHHRYFDPDTARWLSPDPLGLHGGKNLFAFEGSPTEHADPYGLYTRSDFQSFLEKYADKRECAQCSAKGNASSFSASTTAANGNGDMAKNKGEKRPADWDGRKDDKNIHAEEYLVKDKDGNYKSSGDAVGASKAHCANCTNDIIASGNVPSTSIRPSWEPTDQQLGLNPDGTSMPNRNNTQW